MSFEDISPFEDDCKTPSYLERFGNNLASESTFENKSNSVFYTQQCGEHTTIPIKEVLDYQEFIRFINNRKNIECFNWRKYISHETRDTTKAHALPYINIRQIAEADMFSHIKQIIEEVLPIHNPYAENHESFKYLKEFELEESFLNRNVCKISKTPHYEAGIISKKELRTLYFEVFFYYAGTAEARKAMANLPKMSRMYSELPYKAIILRTANPMVFYNFLSMISIDKEKEIMKYIREKFEEAYATMNRDNAEEVNWFYSKIPDFAIDFISIKNLWQDFKQLLEYDARWFIDNSRVMIKVLQIFNFREGGAIYLFKQIHKDGEFIKKIYYGLIGEGEAKFLDNKSYPYKTIFSSLMTIITYEYYLTVKKPIRAKIRFFLGERNDIDSNVTAFLDREGKFTLTREYRGKYWWDFWHSGTTYYLHPLDLVELIIYDKEERFSYVVPSIVAKNIAYIRENESIDNQIRFWGNFIAIAGGIAALASGNPAIMLMAVADIGLATTDIVVQARKDTYMRSETGKKFFATWDNIANYGGLASALVAAPQLVRSLLHIGGKLLTGASKASQATRNFLSMTIAKIILEKNIRDFPRIDVKSVQIGVEDLGSNIRKERMVAFKELEREGIVMAKIKPANGKERFAAFYDGVAILPNTSLGEFIEQLTGLSKLSTKERNRILKMMKRDIPGLDMSKYSFPLRLTDVSEIVTTITKNTTLVGFEFITDMLGSFLFKKANTFLKKVTCVFTPKNTTYPLYELPLESSKIYSTEKILEHIKTAADESEIIKEVTLSEIHKLELTEYINNSCIRKNPHIIIRSMPVHVYSTYGLSKQAKIAKNTLDIITSLNTLNVLRSNYSKFYGEQTAPKLTVEDLKEWNLDDELEALSIILE